MLNFRPRSAQEIVQDAVSKIGNTKYNMFWQNCGHFATNCRYGVNSSQQVCYFNLQIINNCIKALIGQAKYLGKIQWTCVCDIFFYNFNIDLIRNLSTTQQSPLCSESRQCCKYEILMNQTIIMHFHYKKKLSTILCEICQII